MGRMTALVALLLSGCSLLLPRVIAEERVETSSIRVVNDNPHVDVLWWAMEAEQVAAEMDAYLPGVLDILPTLEIRVHNADPEQKTAGEYHGYDGDWIDVWLYEGGHVEARRSSLAHELVHAWEHRVGGISYTEWAICGACENGTDFCDCSLNDYVNAVNNAPEVMRCLPL